MTDPDRASFPALSQAEWRSFLGRLQHGLKSPSHLPAIPPRLAGAHTAPRRYDPPRTSKQDPR